MAQIGISSACYYPQLTEDSFQKVCQTGTDTAELFFNSYSELKPDFVRELARIKDYYGVRVPSVHPFASFTESYYLFSNYPRRFYDSLPLYNRFFEVMNELGARIFVVHGSKIPGSIDDAQYCELFARMVELAKKYNVIFAQENIVDYRSQNPDLLCRMRDAIGSDFKTVFDIKQARRAKVPIYEFLDRLWDTVCHIHVSDFNGDKDCIPPGEGQFNYAELFDYMRKKNYQGAYIEELYHYSYQDEAQIKRGYEYLLREKNKVEKNDFAAEN